MKSFYLSIFSILIFFVITSKASVRNQDQINKIISTDKAGYAGYKVWLTEVNGYDENDEINGYSGIFDEPVTSVTISGGKPYTVHIFRGRWTPIVNGNNIIDINGYAGREDGRTIDAITIADNVEYSVHILGGNWTSPLIGNLDDLNDLSFLDHVEKNPKNYAGIFGKPIDAIMIKGRTYATSYYSRSQCYAQGGECMNPNSCGGTVINGICPLGKGDECCMDFDPKNDAIKINTIKIVIIILMIIIILLIIVIVMYYRIKQNILPPSYEEAINSQDNGSMNNIENFSTLTNNQINVEENTKKGNSSTQRGNSYTQREYQRNDEETMSSIENSFILRKNSSKHSQVKITSNSELVIKL
ncbi:hypothetical protein BCR32DRAFT_327911 [Anaeromyces robustus]|uniref:Jacalin-type lectin domain-containing protein n=1 Tax=Anaeromyces robustus TaxID=1754192 RepID=A0A1Y1X2B1_9FUNG|nr:hypothetical protein BCR32DRAFT_327911 [Anaeromyces robustus]|eukprot:ORX79939.1 hypothetical protein BCR32DRAFT_327911 [Anaeromyces robustus]